MNPHGRLNFETIPFQFSPESADPSIKFWSPLNNFFSMICVAVISFLASRFQHYSIFFVILYRIIRKSSSFSPLFTEYYSQLWQYISFKHHLLRVAMHFERNYQELWRKHVETKRPNDGVVYAEFLFIRERMILTQTSHQQSG